MTATPRPRTPADFEGVLRLYRQFHPGDPVLRDGADRRAFARICASEDLHLLVLDDRSEIVATAYLDGIPNVTRGASPYAVIENVVVDESSRSRGLGKQIMQYALDLAWKAGCYKAMLMTGSTRESTHAFHRACGFSSSNKVGFVARPPTRSTDRRG